MNITLMYGGKDEHHIASDFNALLEKYQSPKQFASPRRSTVPLLTYWKEQGRCLDFLKHLNIQPPASLNLSFEYEVPVQEGEDGKKGEGIPSCTDLMILGDKLVVAVESKYTEPDSETVKHWLRDPPTENRKAVLQGWLSLINQTTGSQLKIDDVMGIAYQTIHRTASACFPHKGKPDICRFMVYQLFTDTEKNGNKIAQDLAILGKMIPPGTIQLVCVRVRLEKKLAFRTLEERWVNGNERDLSNGVREGLIQDSFFGFSQPIACM